MRIPLIAALLAGAPWAVQGQVLFEVQCLDRAMFAEALQERYGESQAWLGQSGADVLFELFVSEDTGTWTIIRTDASGMSCFVSSGDYWAGIAPVAPGVPG